MPFNSSFYNKVEFVAPTAGVNLNLSEESLPSQSASSLVNFIPSPLGSISSRNGTKLLKKFTNETIVDVFPFVSQTDGEESFCFVKKEKVAINGYSDLVVNKTNKTISFSLGATETFRRFLVEGNKLYISYSNTENEFVEISKVSLNENTWAITLKKEPLKDTIQSFSYLKNSLCINNTVLFSFPPVTFFVFEEILGKKIFSNGLDPLKIFNEKENSLTDVSQTVNLELVKNGDSFSVKGTKYASIHLNNHVIVRKDGNAYFISDIDGKNFKLKTSAGDTPTEGGKFDFTVTPPYSHKVFAFGNRLWFLSGGVLNLERKTNDPLLAYYSYNLNSFSSFLDPDTGLIPYLDLSGVLQKQDTLCHIEQYKQYLIFFCKNHIIYYSGFYPDKGDFSFSHVVPAGLFHPQLVQKVGDDLLFVSDGGVKKISTMNLAKQVEISDINNMDILIKSFKEKNRLEKEEYMSCSSAFYNDKNMLFFNLGKNEPIVFSVYNNTYIPYIFSGDFSLATAIKEGVNGVFLSAKDSVVLYQEITEYENDAVNGSLEVLWKTNTISFQGNAFATQFLELSADLSPAAETNNVFTIQVKGASNKNFILSKDIRLQSRGDMLVGFDNFSYNIYGQMTGIIFKEFLKVIVSKVSFIFLGKLSKGKIRIKNLTLFGA